MDVSDLCMSSDEGSPASDVVMNEYVAFISIYHSISTTRVNLVPSGGCQQGRGKVQARFDASCCLSFISFSYNANGIIDMLFL